MVHLSFNSHSFAVLTTDIPGDRTSSGCGLHHLSSFSLSVVSPHLVVLTLLLLLPHNSPCSSPELPSTIFCSHPLQKRQWHIVLNTPLLCLNSSLFSFTLYAPAPCWQWHISLHPIFFPSALFAPCIFHPLYHPSVFAFLYLALFRLLFTMRPAFTPVCQPLTCILATTSPLALMLHAEQANKTPGEWRTSFLAYPPPSLHPVIPSHAKMRPWGNKHLTLNAPVCPHIHVNALQHKYLWRNV